MVDVIFDLRVWRICDERSSSSGGPGLSALDDEGCKKESTNGCALNWPKIASTKGALVTDQFHSRAGLST